MVPQKTYSSKNQVGTAICMISTPTQAPPAVTKYNNLLNLMNLDKRVLPSKQKTFVQRRPNVFDVDPTL